MADLDITQAEADALIAMEKHRADTKNCFFPAEVRILVSTVGHDAQRAKGTIA